jgi:hypothetical protein
MSGLAAFVIMFVVARIIVSFGILARHIGASPKPGILLLVLLWLLRSFVLFHTNNE